MAHITGRVAENLLTGKWALGGDACRYSKEHTLEIFLRKRPATWTKQLDDDLKSLKCRATQDYLTEHATPLEIDTMDKLNLSLVPQMVRASYGKTMAPAYQEGEQGNLGLSIRVATRYIRGQVEATEVWDAPSVKGLFSDMPLMNLMRNAMGSALLQQQVANLTGLVLHGLDLEKFAWGHSARGCAIKGVMTYSDANRVAAAAGNRLVVCRYDCFA
jgi:hypothetical protein